MFRYFMAMLLAGLALSVIAVEPPTERDQALLFSVCTNIIGANKESVSAPDLLDIGHDTTKLTVAMTSNESCSLSGTVHGEGIIGTLDMKRMTFSWKPTK